MRRTALVCILFSFLIMGRGAEACMFAMEHRVYPLGIVPEGVVAVGLGLSRSSNFEGPRYWYGKARLVLLDAGQEIIRELATTKVNTLGPGKRGHFDSDDPLLVAHEGPAPDPCRCTDVETCWCPENTLHHGSSFDVIFTEPNS